MSYPKEGIYDLTSLVCDWSNDTACEEPATHVVIKYDYDYGYIYAFRCAKHNAAYIII
jgi:hypothetical protein